MTVAVLSRRADGCWTARFRYDDDARQALKGLGCRWDPTAKAWTVPAHVVGNVIGALEWLGFDVVREIPPPAGTSTALGLERATEAYLASLPARLREPAFKALLRVLHPDTGGDTKAMQALNLAREQMFTSPERRSA